MVSDVSWKEIQKASKDFVEFVKSRVGTDDLLAIPIVEEAIRIACGDGIRVTERGWKGHFCAAHHCRFGRNTLLEKGNVRVVVSTVGNYVPSGWKKPEILNANNDYYETMVFMAHYEGWYLDADVTKELHEYFSGLSFKDGIVPDNADNLANDMHEATVASVIKALQDNTLPPPRKRYDDED